MRFSHHGKENLMSTTQLNKQQNLAGKAIKKTSKHQHNNFLCKYRTMSSTPTVFDKTLMKNTML